MTVSPPVRPAIFPIAKASASVFALSPGLFLSAARVCAVCADLDDLQAGRTKAVVSNHVVVAGFSHKLKTVLAEFGKADRNGRSVSLAASAGGPPAVIDRPR
jgi:hypothetical protein